MIEAQTLLEAYKTLADYLDEKDAPLAMYEALDQLATALKLIKPSQESALTKPYRKG